MIFVIEIHRSICQIFEVRGQVYKFRTKVEIYENIYTIRVF